MSFAIRHFAETKFLLRKVRSNTFCAYYFCCPTVGKASVCIKMNALPEHREMSDFYFSHNKVVPAYLYIV